MIQWIELYSSIFLTGLIWVIQLVHYPSFQFCDPSKAKAFHDFHCRRISYVVIPLMFAELFSGAWSWWHRDFATVSHIAFGALILIWISTFAIQIPLHNRLAEKMDAGVIQKLVLSNWIRTFLWSFRSLLLFLFIAI